MKYGKLQAKKPGNIGCGIGTQNAPNISPDDRGQPCILAKKSPGTLGLGVGAENAPNIGSDVVG